MSCKVVPLEFIISTIFSIIVVYTILWCILSFRKYNLLKNKILSMFVILLEIVCMIIAKYGANIHLPWWIYYPVPMIITLVVPLIYFKFTKIESLLYISLILVSAPIIHILLSLFGWHNYMPFIKIPSIL